MSAHDPEFNWQPSPEQLSAYVDRELDEVALARIEAWLGDHPQAAEEVAHYRRLSAAFRDTAAPSPTEEAWRTTWEGINARQAVAAGSLLGRRSPWMRFAVGALAAAAVLLLAVFLLNRTAVTPPHEHESEPPFVVATDEDVHIETVHGDDVRALVVGQPPLPGPLTLAANEDIELLAFQPSDDGRLPDLRWFESGPAPMIVAPFADPAPREED
jgi:hypothetical protein